ncbi:ribonuclease HII, partial [Rhizobium leguminosarum]
GDQLPPRERSRLREDGFAAHVGYGTAQHRAGIERQGPCSLHRMSFRPLRKTENGPETDEMLSE